MQVGIRIDEENLETIKVVSWQKTADFNQISEKTFESKSIF